MQARRFAFTAGAIADEAWRRHRVVDHDPDGFFQPLKQSLLDLSAVRSEEDVLLDEHFRCLPPIIEFSNERWYGSRLRIMTDERRKRFGPPDQPIIELHHIVDGEVREGGQENQREAEALVASLGKMLSDPSYGGATFGVICPF